jgi:glycosyltransferase involved in cell wall biosynthesis
MKKYSITVFTPTFNRRNTLIRLYQSLCNQTNNDFTWLIIDDGSKDGTEELVYNWIRDNLIDIKYHFQQNQGKASAYNIALNLVETKLFFCVDSDDYLIPSTIEDILNVSEGELYNSYDLTGILAFKGCGVNKPLTTLRNSNIKSFTLQDGYRKFGLRGDAMLVYKSSLIKQFRFPIINNEKFFPEAYLYDLIDQHGRLFIVRKILYLVEYLQGGYTSQINQLITNNPHGYKTFIMNRIKNQKYSFRNFVDYIRLNSISIVINKRVNLKNIPLIYWVTIPFGIVIYFMRFHKYTS